MEVVRVSRVHPFEEFAMKTQILAVALSAAVLGGCAGAGPSPCEVFSPAPVVLPSNQNDVRVEASSTGDPTLSESREQDCP